MDIKKLLDQVLSSVFYSNSVNKASRMSKNAVGVLELLKSVLNKLNKDGKESILKTVSTKILTLIDLVKSVIKGDYKELETKNMILILAGFIYLISPIDIIPDFIPLLGFADDIALISFIFKAMAEEIEKFELWKMNPPQ